MRGIVKTPIPRKGGYVSVSIRGRDLALHRLVATAFLGPPPTESHQVDHINMNPSDNSKINLEWVTPSENIRRSFAYNLTRGSSASQDSKPIKARIFGSDDEWIPYPSVNECSRELNLDHGSMKSAANGSRKRVGKYEFEWDAPNEVSVLPGEVWKPVVGASNLGISSLGRFKDHNGVVKTPSVETKGYQRVRIHGKKTFVHRLVAYAFLGPPPPSLENPTVDHLNMNPSDNRAVNLEWVSQAENNQRSYCKNASRRTSASKTSKPVKVRRFGSDDEWVRYESAATAARMLNMSDKNIAKVLYKRARYTKGYEFVFDMPNEEDVLPGEEWREFDV